MPACSSFNFMEQPSPGVFMGELWRPPGNLSLCQPSWMSWDDTMSVRGLDLLPTQPCGIKQVTLPEANFPNDQFTKNGQFSE